MFNKNSGLVKIWVRLIKTGQKVTSDIPEIDNLKDVVLGEL